MFWLDFKSGFAKLEIPHSTGLQHRFARSQGGNVVTERNAMEKTTSLTAGGWFFEWAGIALKR